MTVWTRDTFDLVGVDGIFPPGLPVGEGKWDGADGIFGAGWGAVSTPTPYGFGKALRTSPFFGGWVYKRAPSNEKRAFCAVLARCDTGPWFIAFDDDATAQVNISWDGNSFISINNAHGELGRWENAYTIGQWNHFEIRVEIDHVSGIVRIRKNGSTKDDFEACGDTQVSANAWTNQVRLVTQNNSAYSYVKQFAAWDMQGPGPWNNWIGELRAMARMPKRDASVTMAQTIPTGDPNPTDFGFTGDIGPATLDPNTIYLYPVPAPTIGGLLGNLTLKMDSGVTGNVQAALYAAGGTYAGIQGNGAAPGRLLAQTDPLVNPVSGDNVMTWSGSAPSVATGAKYWLALWGDVAFTPRFQNGASGSFYLATPYTGSPPDPFTPDLALINAGAFPPTLHCDLTISNAGLVGELNEDAATTMVSSATPGDIDMYGIEELPPEGFTDIKGLDLTMMVAKSTAGTRGVKSRMLSGSTLLQEPEVTPAVGAFNQSYRHQDTDPDTGLPWDQAAVNALEIGEEIST